MYHDSEEEKLLLTNIDKICKDHRRIELKKVYPYEEDKQKIHTFIEDYIKENNCIVYGGRAYDILINIKNKKERVYSELDYPDIEFYSRNLKKDIMSICKIISESGYSVMAEEGQHQNTFRIIVEHEIFCDISGYPEKFINSIPFITINGVCYAEPPYLYLDVLKVYSYPIDNFFRLSKTFKRANKLLKYYPIKFEIKKINKFDNKFSNKILSIVPKTCIVTDIVAYNFYVSLVNGTQVSIPYLTLLSTNYKEDKKYFKRQLKKVTGEKIKTRKYYPFLDYLPKKTEYYYEKDNKKYILVQLYKEKNKCIPFYEENKCKYTTIQNTLYYLFAIRQKLIMDFLINNNEYVKEQISIKESLIQNLINAKKKYYSTNPKSKLFEKGPFQEFVVECLGNPIPTIKLNRLKINKRKKNKEILKYRYIPNGENTLQKLQLKLHTGEEKKTKKNHESNVQKTQKN